VNVDALLDGFEPLWTEVNRRLSILSWLHGNRRIKDEDVKKVFSAIRFQLETDDAALNEWRKAVAALQSDPDKELPK
jgi:hypothetical protein